MDDGSCITVVLGCTDSTLFNYNAAANIDDGSCIYLAIGVTYGGGIFFWLDGNGGGLIAAPYNQSNGTNWGCYGIAIGKAIGTGAQNIINIVNAGCGVGTAADICANYTDGKYSDWFLPSREELRLMFVNLQLQELGGFANNFYWSSTEDDNFYAWLRSFTNGYEYPINKNSTNSIVRDVRAF